MFNQLKNMFNHMAKCWQSAGVSANGRT